MLIAPLSPVDKERLIGFLADLIRIPSPSTGEEQVARRLADEMQAVGFEHVYIDCIGNVVGHIGPRKGPVLLYDGHMDTVGMGDVHAWTRDPYSALVQDGYIYGLGAADMKGSLAAMVYGVKALVDAKVELGGDLYVVGVVQEEPCEGLAISTFLEKEKLRPDYVVVGEATDMQIARGQRGRMELKVTTQGHSAHAAMPERGVNAIHAAARIIVGIELLALDLDEDPVLGKGSITVTHIESQSRSRNAVPELCFLYIDRRLTSSETETKVLTEMRRLIGREGVKADVEVTEYTSTSYTGYPCKARQYYPAWVTPENHFLVQRAIATVEEVLGYRPRVGHWRFSTDGVYTAGVAGIPTIGFGPGDERFAHAPDERIRIKDVMDAAQVYAQLAVNILGTVQP